MDATQRSLIHAAVQDGATSTGMRVFTQAPPWFLFCLYFQLLSVNAGFSTYFLSYGVRFALTSDYTDKSVHLGIVLEEHRFENRSPSQDRNK